MTRGPSDLPPDREISAWLETAFRNRSELRSAVAATVDRDGVRRWAGRRRGGADAEQPDLDAVFDLASLAKPVTGTLALALDAAGELPLRLRIGEVWPRAIRPLADRRLEDLLRHRAGLAPWAPLARLGSDLEAVVGELVGDARWHGAREGTYSDLGPILWCRAAERRLGRSSRRLLEERVLVPAGLIRGLRPGPVDPGRVEPLLLDGTTEQRLAGDLGFGIDRAGPPASGEPQDGNARWLGGYAGHAGLFGTARGVAAFGRRWLLAESVPDGDQRERALRGRGRYALGWWRRRVRNSAGPALSPRAFGHIGFTGGSLWIDPAIGRVFVLLAHRDRVVAGLDVLRRDFHRRFAPVETARVEPPL